MNWLLSGSRWKMALAIVAMPLLLAGCGGLDFSLKDAEWFNRPSGMFNRNITLETPGFADSRPVADSELISPDGFCAGMTAPTEANALTDPSVIDPSAPMAEASQGMAAAIALGRTECEVARAAGAPDNVAVSSEGGQRVAVLTYLRGERPGIYRFTSGRLVSMERAAEPPPPPHNTRGQRPRRQG